MGYVYAIAPQIGELVVPLHSETPGGQRCIVQHVSAYQPDNHVWSVSLAYEHNANGRGAHIQETGDRVRWLEVELP